MSYHNIKSFNPKYEMWMDNPEPNRIELDPYVVLDTNMDGLAWMFDTMNSEESWISYSGELALLEP